MVDYVRDFYYTNPQFEMMVYVLEAYVGVYICSLFLTHTIKALRRGRTPLIDRIAQRSLLWCFMIHTIGPIYCIYILARNQQYRGTEWFHYIPYVKLKAQNAKREPQCVMVRPYISRLTPQFLISS